nr:M20/M25/M40 family metallo-hydrolase [uncultured Caproiciproducens sp.]
MLEELAQIWGVSGSENQVSDYLISKCSDYVDEVKVDAIGNLIMVKRGSGVNRKKIMCAAHMDEIGLCVIAVTDDGFIKAKQMGGVSAIVSYMSRVKFKNGAVGTLSAVEKITDGKLAGLDKLYVDIGASSREEALQHVAIGEPAVFVGDYVELVGRNVMSKAFDDRSACYIMASTIQNMGVPYHDVYFVFTVQEEVGLRGATVAAEAIHPDLGIAIDITGSFDVPADDLGNAINGGGAAIKVNDASVICDEKLVNAMVECARKNNIKYQMDVLANGGTDAGAINRSGKGVKTVGISIPTRYGHTPNSIINLDDVDACIHLLRNYIQEPLPIETEIVIKQLTDS